MNDPKKKLTDAVKSLGVIVKPKPADDKTKQTGNTQNPSLKQQEQPK